MKVILSLGLMAALTGCYLKPIGLVVDQYCGAVGEELREDIRNSVNSEGAKGVVMIKCKGDDSE